MKQKNDKNSAKAALSGLLVAILVFGLLWLPQGTPEPILQIVAIATIVANGGWWWCSQWISSWVRHGRPQTNATVWRESWLSWTILMIVGHAATAWSAFVIGGNAALGPVQDSMTSNVMGFASNFQAGLEEWLLARANPRAPLPEGSLWEKTAVRTICGLALGGLIYVIGDSVYQLINFAATPSAATLDMLGTTRNIIPTAWNVLGLFLSSLLGYRTRQGRFPAKFTELGEILLSLVLKSGIQIALSFFGNVWSFQLADRFANFYKRAHPNDPLRLWAITRSYVSRIIANPFWTLGIIARLLIEKGWEALRRRRRSAAR